MIKKYAFQLLLFTFILTAGRLSSQSITIVKHDLSTFNWSLYKTYFAEGNGGNIWAVQRGAFAPDDVLQYDGSAWAQVAFDNCSYCIHTIAADNNGKIHLGTTSGIYSWNGNGWEQVSDKSVADSDMTFDSQNILWFKSGSDENNLASLAVDGTLTEYPSVSGDIFEITVATDDRIWLRIANEVVVFDGNTPTAYPEISDPLYIEEASDGKIWVTDSFGGISYIENGTVTNNALAGVTVSGLHHNSFAIDQTNNIFWFGQQGVEPGLIFYNGNTSKYIPSDNLFMDGFSTGLVDRCFVASNGTIWVGSNFVADVAEVTPGLSAVFEPDFLEAALFPNPATTGISINMGLASQVPVRVIVYDQLGQIVFSEKITPDGDNLKVDIHQLIAGKYFITLPDDKVFGRFVKEN